MDILPLFADIDDFCLLFEPAYRKHLLSNGAQQRRKPSRLANSEVMTILVLFHQSGYRNFKTFYQQYVIPHLNREFRHLVSYNRFVELQRDALFLLWAYLFTRRGECTGISFVDATKLVVCHNLRITRHRALKDFARRGKTSTGWFYGFKLHLIINDCGALLGFYLSPGNEDDRKPVPAMARKLWGKLFGDKGYISKTLTALLQEQDLQLMTKLKKGMPQKFMSLSDKLHLRHRAIIETVIDQLKNISQVEHTRHRSFWNFLGNIAGSLIAYSWQAKKPRLDITIPEEVQEPLLLSGQLALSTGVSG
jgi:Transposase DDE domain